MATREGFTDLNGCSAVDFSFSETFAEASQKKDAALGTDTVSDLTAQSRNQAPKSLKTTPDALVLDPQYPRRAQTSSGSSSTFPVRAAA